jgi:hypothetical protein
MFKWISAHNKDILAIIFLCLCSFIFLNKLFLESRIFTSQDIGQGDITHNSYPILNSYAQSLKTMKIPLWTNSISTGFPIFAENATFFLFNIIAYFLFPTYFAFNLSYLIVFITASIGTYFYCRYLGLTRSSSVFASIAYAFSFFFVGHVLHIAVLQAISLFPWLIFFVDKYFSKGSRLYLMLFVIIFSEQFLTGFIQCVVYSIIAIYIVMFIRYLKKPYFAKKIFFLTLACLLAIGLAGMQILPTYELYTQSTRNVSLADNSRFFYTYKDLIYFINPFFWGDPSKATYIRNPVEGLFWENNIYSGIIPFIFLIIGFLYFKKRKIIRPYVYLFFLSLAFSLGWFFFLKYIPPFSMFRLSQRALFLTSFAFAIIAGFGFDQVFHALKKKISNNFLIILIGIIIVAAFLDLFLNGQGYNGGISKDKWLEAPETAKYLQDQKISGRIFSLVGTDWLNVYNNISHGWRSENAEKLLSTRAILNPDTNMLYGIASVNGYTAYRTLDSVLFNQIMLSGSSEDKKAVKLGSSSAKLLGLENVQYVVSAKNILSDSNDFELVWQKQNNDTKSTYKIYKNKQFIENIYPVKRVIVEISTQQMIDDLLSPNFTPKDTALIYNLNTVRNFPDEVLITDIKNDDEEITFHTNSLGNSFIVISNSYYPGWKAFVDNQEVDILEVNINSQGLQIKPGKHNVKLFYDPTSYKVGKFITIMSWLIVATIIFWPIVRRIIKQKKLEI